MESNDHIICLFVVLILFVLCSCCCFLIIRYLFRGEYFEWMDDFKIFGKILRNVPFNKYSMEIKDSIDITNFDILKGFDKNLTIMSSNKRAIVIIDKKIVLETGENGLNFIVFSRTKHKLILKYIQSFDIGCCRNNIIDMVNFIDKISVNDITIVVSRGLSFKIFSNKYDKTAQLGIKSLKFLRISLCSLEPLCFATTSDNANAEIIRNIGSITVLSLPAN